MTVELLARRRAHSRNNNSKTEEALKLCRIEEGSSSEFAVYSFAEMAAATGDFSDENLLGKGGFGPVYKASWRFASGSSA